MKELDREELDRLFDRGVDLKKRLVRIRAIDPNHPCRGGNFFSHAVNTQDSPIVRDLLARGARVDSLSSGHSSPLMRLLDEPALPLLRLVLRREPIVDWRDDDGRTALIWATLSGNSRAVRALLAAGANPSAYDHEGKTALIHAETYGDEASAKLLRKAEEKAREGERPPREKARRKPRGTGASRKDRAPAIRSLRDLIRAVGTGTRGIAVDAREVALLDRQVARDPRLEEMLDESFADFRGRYPWETDPEVRDFLALGAACLEWRRPEQEPREGYLAGGCYFRSPREACHTERPNFWESSLDAFRKAGVPPPPATKTLEALRAFESPAPIGGAVYSPQFGCFRSDSKRFAREFFFYDSGLVYRLPFRTFGEYLEGLARSAAVVGWQYFFLDPAEIVAANRGLPYITWKGHVSSNLAEEIGRLTYDPKIPFDRLDLVAEHLERCVRLLPPSFPKLDFSRHRKWHARFRRLYDGARTAPAGGVRR